MKLSFLYSLVFFLSNSCNLFALGITFFSRNLIISLSLVPAWIFKIFIFFLSPLLSISDNFLISDVLPQPVSPIIITGILDLILNNINAIFK